MMNVKTFLILFVVSYQITFFPVFGNKCYDPIACFNQIKHITSNIQEQLIQLLDGSSTNVTQPQSTTNSTHTIILLFREVTKLVNQIRTSVADLDGNKSIYIYKLSLYMKMYPLAISARCIEPMCTTICILEHRGSRLFEKTEFLLHSLKSTFIGLGMFDGLRTCCNSQVYNIDGVLSCISPDDLNSRSDQNQLRSHHHERHHDSHAVSRRNGHHFCPCDSEVYNYDGQITCSQGDPSNMCIICANGEKHFVKFPYARGTLCSGH